MPAASALLIPPGAPPIPTAAQRNGLAALLRRCNLRATVDRKPDAKPFPHPWKVTPSRLEISDGMTIPDGTWRFDVRPGFINDLPPPILYRRKSDPRGWTPPGGYVESGDTSADWVERSCLDDTEDPPYLVRRPAPSIVSMRSIPSTPSDWALIADTDRRAIEDGAFCGEADWELELWRAHVLLSGAPLDATFYGAQFRPPALKTFRLYASSHLPSASFGAASGGWLELATLYLLRDAKSPDEAAVRIRQRVFWNLWAVIVQPGADIPGEISAPVISTNTGLGFADTFAQGINAANQSFADLALQQLQSTLEGASSVQFWTV